MHDEFVGSPYSMDQILITRKYVKDAKISLLSLYIYIYFFLPTHKKSIFFCFLSATIKRKQKGKRKVVKNSLDMFNWSRLTYLVCLVIFIIMFYHLMISWEWARYLDPINSYPVKQLWSQFCRAVPSMMLSILIFLISMLYHVSNTSVMVIEILEATWGKWKRKTPAYHNVDFRGLERIRVG